MVEETDPAATAGAEVAEAAAAAGTTPDPANIQAAESEAESEAADATYVKLPEGSSAQMDSFARQRVAATLANTAADYDISGNHCFTFSMEVVAAGGANGSVAGAEELDVIVVVAGIGKSVDQDIDLPSRQIQVVQSREQTLSVSRGGAINGSFSFP